MADQLFRQATQALDHDDVASRLRLWVEAAAVREGVEIDCTSVALSLQLDQELKRLNRMHARHHQSIVALGVAVVELDAK